MARFKLKLTSLKFLSAVDTPAQETATARLIKRAGAPQITATARVAKLSSDELGLVFGWALTTKAGGSDYFDLHGDNILEEDLIKVAAEFLENGGATDQMHDDTADGRVVFAMPLTAEVAKAFGIETDTLGLMVAIKPSTEVFAKFKSGEYTGFSIAGTGERALAKYGPGARSLGYTVKVDGHQHQVFESTDGIWTSHNTADGAEYGHSHAVVRGMDGTLTILADSGHAHQIAVEESMKSLARAPESPRSPAPVTKDSIMTLEEALAEIKDLKAKLAELDKSKEDLEEVAADAEKRATLTDAQRAYLKSLDKVDAKAFLAKSTSEREADIAKSVAADPIEVEFNGQQFRKSAGTAVIELAKAAKTQAEQLAKRDAEIEKAEVRSFAKAHLGALAGTDEQHDLIVKAVRKSGADAKLIDETLTAIKGWSEIAATKSTAPGFGGTSDDVSKAGKVATFTAKLAEFAKAAGKTPQAAQIDFVRTPEGAELYAAATA